MVNVTHYHKHISFPLMLYLIACNDFPYSLSFCLYATDKKKKKEILFYIHKFKFIYSINNTRCYKRTIEQFTYIF